MELEKKIVITMFAAWPHIRQGVVDQCRFTYLTGSMLGIAAMLYVDAYLYEHMHHPWPITGIWHTTAVCIGLTGLLCSCIIPGKDRDEIDDAAAIRGVRIVGLCALATSLGGLLATIILYHGATLDIEAAIILPDNTDIYPMQMYILIVFCIFIATLLCIAEKFKHRI